MFFLHLQSCNLGTQVREVKNPFTGEVLVVPIDLGLTASERDAVRALLAEAGASPPDPDTYCRVVLRDGNRVDVAVGGLYTDATPMAIAVEYNALSPEVASFVHALASRGNMSIISGVDPAVVALPLPTQRTQVASRWPEAPVVEAPSDLEAWLRQNIR
jgi:hypothetical protein